MADEIRCWLPFPISVNNAFPTRVIRGVARRVPSAQYAKWRAAALVYLRSERIKPFKEPVIVKLQLIPKDTRPRDCDNYNKGVLDSLVAAGVLVDDSNEHVKAVIAWWENPSLEPGCIVTIRPAANLGRGALAPKEMRLLAGITAKPLLVGATHRPSEPLRRLLDLGYVETIPGLMPDAPPQGYRAVVS